MTITTPPPMQCVFKRGSSSDNHDKLYKINLAIETDLARYGERITPVYCKHLSKIRYCTLRSTYCAFSCLSAGVNLFLIFKKIYVQYSDQNVDWYTSIAKD
ncbi:hypothetical protein KM043_017786 [Ampulex compressa]|nr:hypothetical protein KM043_017786 [Ampulex compressa]